jgi:putative polyketide hydroxylase
VSTIDTELEQVQVVVVGAGPAGLVSAIMLASQGIGTLVVERQLGPSPLPRATGVSTRTMELVRAFGLEDRVRAGEVKVKLTGALVTRSLATAAAGTVMPMVFPTPEQAAAVSPTGPGIVPQDHLESVLLDHLLSYPAAQVRFGTELASFEQGQAGLTVVLRELATGAVTTIDSRYLIGADGAHSTVRDRLGIAMEGPGHLAENITVLFQAPVKELVGEQYYGIYFITDPGTGGIFAPGGGGRWLHGFDWDPAHERLEDYTEARLTDRIRAASGMPELPVRILRVGAFAFAAQMAERYRQGNVILVGDAAHRLTPKGALGMNTAIHDAHHLGWKLAWVLRGWAGPELLDTYEAERRPVAARNVARSAQDQPEWDVARSLAEDLGGRLAHAWLVPGEARVSTLDLLGPGLTLLAGPAGSAWVAAAAATLGAPVPVTAHVLDGEAAEAVGAGSAGAVLVRPDGQVVARWPAAALGSARADLAAAVENLTGELALVGG